MYRGIPILLEESPEGVVGPRAYNVALWWELLEVCWVQIVQRGMEFGPRVERLVGFALDDVGLSRDARLV